MKLLTAKTVPVLITGLVLAVIFLIQAVSYKDPNNFISKNLGRIEAMSFDWRVQMATNYPQPVASNLAAVFIDEDTLELLKDPNNGLNFTADYPFPRHIYGRLIRELAAQGAKAVGVDIILGEKRRLENLLISREEAAKDGFTAAEIKRLIESPGSFMLTNDTSKEVRQIVQVDSDDFFAVQLRQASNTVLAANTMEGVAVADIFATNALALADVSVRNDSDGYLRHIQPFVDYRKWHPAIEQWATLKGYLLSQVKIRDNKIIFPKEGGKSISVPLNSEGYFDPRELGGNSSTNQPVTLEKAFTMHRIWHMGFVLAARVMNLDLNSAVLDARTHRLVLRGSGGRQRIVPLDRDNKMAVNWLLTWNDPRLLTLSAGAILSLDCLRNGQNPSDTKVYIDALREETKKNLKGDLPFRDKIVLVGSVCVGSNLRDLGPTPLSPQTFFVSCHWNVANALIMNQFIQKSSYLTEVILLLLLGVASAGLTLKLRGLWATFLVICLVAAYVAVAGFLYVKYIYWLPVVLPVLGSLLMTHVCMVTHRVLLEQRERRRVRSIFAKLVSPNVVNEVLNADQLSLGGTRRKITVYFADIRGFTEMTDVTQARAEEHVRQNNLTGQAAQQYFDEHARDVLATVNLYLGLISDAVKKHNGTLDKYIGDCVMAFWGAPTPNEQHALSCIRAAIDSQRAIYEANQKRVAENQRREQENIERAKSGQPLLPMLSVLSLGTGINTGMVTVGLMGSQENIFNYTVFGREVNLASRLEGLSGRGRIIVSEVTFAELQRDDPALAATCVKQPPAKVKGIHDAVITYEVPWKTSQPDVAQAAPETQPPPAPAVSNG